jgi:hypothetical protein
LDLVGVVPGIIALEIKPVREQLKQIEKRLDTIEQHYAKLKGVTKEIDDIRAERNSEASRHREEDCGLITLEPRRRLCAFHALCVGSAEKWRLVIAFTAATA